MSPESRGQSSLSLTWINFYADIEWYMPSRICEWISNFISHFTIDVITYADQDLNELILIKQNAVLQEENSLFTLLNI